MNYRLKVAAAVLISLGASHARATGIPVIDVANLFQAVQQVINDITQINNQIQQIRQLQTQIESINGMRNLADSEERFHPSGNTRHFTTIDCSRLF